ncbi:MAG TPA: hypothetical protein VIL49_18450 [Capillimicrobium sp.]|jgi:hypothetical protein
MHRMLALRLAAATAGATALLAAPAAAATPVGGALYGGGAETVDGDMPEYTTIRVQKGAERLNFYGEWALRCTGGGEDLSFVTAEDVRLRRDGSFSGEGAIEGEGPLGSQSGTFTFSGRFTARHIAKGVARADVDQTLTAGGGAACTTGRFRFTVIDAQQRGAIATPKAGAQFYGSTSQTYPALLRLDGRGRALTFASVEYELACEGAEPLFLDERMPARFIDLERDGTFSGTETFTDQATVNGSPLEVTARLEGAFRRGKVRGTWRMTAVARDPATGAQTATCSSERITFRVARG